MGRLQGSFTTRVVSQGQCGQQGVNDGQGFRVFLDALTALCSILVVISDSEVSKWSLPVPEDGFYSFKTCTDWPL